MTRLRGHTPIGKRLSGKTAYRHWKITAFVSPGHVSRRPGAGHRPADDRGNLACLRYDIPGAHCDRPLSS